MEAGELTRITQLQVLRAVVRRPRHRARRRRAGAAPRSANRAQLSPPPARTGRSSLPRPHEPGAALSPSPRSGPPRGRSPPHPPPPAPLPRALVSETSRLKTLLNVTTCARRCGRRRRPRRRGRAWRRTCTRRRRSRCSGARTKPRASSTPSPQPRRVMAPPASMAPIASTAPVAEDAPPPLEPLVCRPRARG